MKIVWQDYDNGSRMKQECRNEIMANRDATILNRGNFKQHFLYRKASLAMNLLKTI